MCTTTCGPARPAESTTQTSRVARGRLACGVSTTWRSSTSECRLPPSVTDGSKCRSQPPPPPQPRLLPLLTPATPTTTTTMLKVTTMAAAPVTTTTTAVMMMMMMLRRPVRWKMTSTAASATMRSCSQTAQSSAPTAMTKRLIALQSASRRGSRCASRSSRGCRRTSTRATCERRRSWSLSSASSCSSWTRAGKKRGRPSTRRACSLRSSAPWPPKRASPSAP